MAELAARHPASAGASPILVANPTDETARRLAFRCEELAKLLRPELFQ